MKILRSQRPIFCVIFLTVLLIDLNSCKRANEPPVETLPFETIVKDSQSGYRDEVPALFIITEPEDVMSISDYIGADILSEIQDIDFGKHFIVAVFQGWKATMNYCATVHFITRRDQSIEVLTSFKQPKPGEALRNIVTSPYHIIKVKRPGNFSGNFTFALREVESP